MGRKVVLGVIVLFFTIQSPSAFAMGMRRGHGGGDGGMGGSGGMFGGNSGGGMFEGTGGCNNGNCQPPQGGGNTNTGTNNHTSQGHAPTLPPKPGRPTVNSAPHRSATYKQMRSLHKDLNHNPTQEMLVAAPRDLSGKCVDSNNKWHSALLQTAVLDKDKKEVALNISIRDSRKLNYWKNRLNENHDDTKEELATRRKKFLDEKSYVTRALGDNISEDSGLIFHRANSEGKNEGTHFMKIGTAKTDVLLAGSDANNNVQLYVHAPAIGDKLGQLCTFDFPDVVKKNGRFLIKMDDGSTSHKKNKSHSEDDYDDGDGRVTLR